MALIERYRLWYEHERDCNAKTLAMLESVPPTQREDPRFARAVCLAAHLAACRWNWLLFLRGEEGPLDPWWQEDATIDGLRSRHAEVEAAWSEYLAGLTDETLVADFEFAECGQRFRWNVEGQIHQLAGHADYHRGQIALLVDMLGGEAVETDYVYWAIDREPRYGEVGEG